MSEDESRYVSLAEVKELLTEEAEERELNYEQSLALGHAEKFVELSMEETEKLMDELRENFDFMSEELVYKTADILPEDEDGVRAIFQQDRFTPSNDDAEEIINIIKKYK
ncbi:MAG: RNA polymerase Rpb4 family protein [Candidatus Natronoplasma sp.]